jgi:hypothetical protein
MKRDRSDRREVLLTLYVEFVWDTFHKEGFSERYKAYHRIVMALTTGDPVWWLRRSLENAPDERRQIYLAVLEIIENWPK